MGLNMLEVKSEEQKDFAVQEMISIFYKLVTDPAMLGPSPWPPTAMSVWIAPLSSFCRSSNVNMRPLMRSALSRLRSSRRCSLSRSAVSICLRSVMLFEMWITAPTAGSSTRLTPFSSRSASPRASPPSVPDNRRGCSRSAASSPGSRPSGRGGGDRRGSSPGPPGSPRPHPAAGCPRHGGRCAG